MKLPESNVERKAQIPIVPLIDVVFLLLAAFVVAARCCGGGSLSLPLLESKAAQSTGMHTAITIRLP